MSQRSKAGKAGAVCGVCASTAASPDHAQRTVARINAAQGHRGPDGAFSAIAGASCLGNTRLAIITPGSDGDQPLHAPDGSCTAVFNGEVYNYRELIRDHGLSPGGSDGAVIPQLYSRYGTAAFGLLRGMFAIVLADLKTGCLFLARDPLGIKPLHWRRTTDELLVSSEVRPLMRTGDCVDPAAIARFLHLGSLSTGGSPFKEISAVPPNMWLAFQDRDLVDQGHVEPNLEVAACLSRDVAKELRDSVALHLRSDVPTALLLSSGLDSSALAWAARGAGQPLHCLTVDLGGGREEATDAARTALRFGHSHEVVRRTPTTGDVHDFFGAMQRPSLDGLNTFVVCRAVQEAGLKVALSGLGGDEATGGYSHFRYLRHLRSLAVATRAAPVRTGMRLGLRAGRSLLPTKAHEMLGGAGPRDAWNLSLLQRRVWSRDLVVRGLVLADDADLVQEAAVGTGRLDSPALTAAEYRLYLQSTLLPDADAFSMASSVELRVPLVDRFFLGAAVGAGGAAGLGKARFAQALGDQRLVELASRPKQGFSLPIDDWMRRGLLRDHLQLVHRPEAPVWEHVDPAAGRWVINEWQHGRLPWSHAWGLVVLDQWLRSLA